MLMKLLAQHNRHPTPLCATPARSKASQGKYLMLCVGWRWVGNGMEMGRQSGRGATKNYHLASQYVLHITLLQSNG